MKLNFLSIAMVGLMFIVSSGWGVVGYAEFPGCPDQSLNPEARFKRGDCSGEGIVNINDVVVMLKTRFLGTFCPPCQRACDYNDDGNFDISDPIGLLEYLYLGGLTPPAPGALECGVEPSVNSSDFGCEVGCGK